MRTLPSTLTLQSFGVELAYILKTATGLLFLAQIPEIAYELFQGAVTPEVERKPIVALTVLVPFFIVSSSISIALTYRIVLSLYEQSKPSKEILQSVLRTLKPLLLAGFVAGVATLVGLPIILPAIYFAACFLFVPFLIQDDPTQTVTFYLMTSRKLCHKHLRTCLCVATGMMALGLVSHFGGTSLAYKVAGVLPRPFHLPCAFIVKSLVSVVAGVVANSFTSLLFLYLKRN